MARAPWLSYEAQTTYREHYRAARPGWLSSGEQFDAPEKVFTDVARALKPGGHFLFLTPNALNPLIFGNVSALSRPYTLDKANTPSRLRHLAADLGVHLLGDLVKA